MLEILIEIAVHIPFFKFSEKTSNANFYADSGKLDTYTYFYFIMHALKNSTTNGNRTRTILFVKKTLYMIHCTMHISLSCF